MYTPPAKTLKYSLGFKNKIINGNFDFWQRGFDFTGYGTSQSQKYLADRWQLTNTCAAVHYFAASGPAPTLAQSGAISNSVFLADCTTADTSLASGDIVAISQKIEGYNWADLAQKSFTLSFWVKATKTGIYSVAFRNSNADRSYVAEYTINSADTWEKKIITVLPSPAHGTWNYTNGIGLEVTFVLAAGTGHQTSNKNIWQVGSYAASNNQVNGVDSTANNFYLSQVQLEAGIVATPFEVKPFSTELEMCQRYYEKSYNLNTTEVSGSGLGAERAYFITNWRHQIRFVTRKRTTITSVKLWAPVTGAENNAYSYSASTNRAISVDSGTNVGETAGGVVYSATVNEDMGFQWTCDAEL